MEWECFGSASESDPDPDTDTDTDTEPDLHRTNSLQIGSTVRCKLKSPNTARHVTVTQPEAHSWKRLFHHNSIALLDEDSLPKINITTTAESELESRFSQFSALPVYQHPDVKFQDNMIHRGGGRGFVATRDLAPGTLVLVEEPVADMPPPDVSSLYCQEERCLLSIFNGTDARRDRALQNIAHLHPKKLGDVDPTHLQNLRDKYLSVIRRVRAHPSCISLEGSAELSWVATDNGILRLLCCLNFNGFESGVYLHLAIINHSCRPNCIKLAHPADACSKRTFSQIRTTVNVLAGTEITICYLIPRLQPLIDRRLALQRQFQFSCTCQLCQEESMALQCYRDEATINSCLRHCENVLKGLKTGLINPTDAVASSESVVSKARLPEMVSGDKKGQLHTPIIFQIIMSQIYNAAVNAAQEKLQLSNENCTSMTDLGMLLQVLWALAQDRLSDVGPIHPSFSEVLGDLADVVSRLLGSGREGIIVLSACGHFGTSSDAAMHVRSSAAAFEAQCCHLVRRIKELYDVPLVGAVGFLQQP